MVASQEAVSPLVGMVTLVSLRTSFEVVFAPNLMG